MNEVSIIKEKEVFDIIKTAVNKTVGLIKHTYGPASNKVIISKVTHKMVVDDGVQIARDLEFSDNAENAVLSVIRETAIRTNDRVGDGTTSSLIMLEAIIDEVAKMSRRDGRKIEKELKKGFTEAKAQLLAMSQPIKTKEELEKVARISFDDEKVSKIIADTWFKIGKDGVVTVDKSGTMETVAEITDGITIDRGFISPYMVTNPSRMEGLIEKPYILITDYRMTEAQDILPIMNLLAAKGIMNLVVIADNIEGAALSTIIVNKLEGKFNAIAINTPKSDNQSVALEDLAIMVGAKVFSQHKGDKLELATINELGRATRFISHRDSSVIIGPKGKKEDIKKAVEELQAAIQDEKNETQKQDLQKRLARFGNKVAVIKVGAATENEERSLRYKVEDAVNAVRSAFRGGVVCGGGLSLSRINTSSPILNNALKYPYKQLCENVGVPMETELNDDEAVNVVTGKAGKYMTVGVIDPVEVLIAGVESAVSIASLLITTTGMIVEAPKKPEIQNN